MEPNPDGNARKYPRMSAAYVVAVRRVAADGTPSPLPPLLCRTRTLGLGGLLFESPDPFDPGDRIELELVLGERTVPATATVVYREPGREEACGIGVQFVEISEEDRDLLLNAYLEQEYRLPAV